MAFTFALLVLLFWGGADLFYKKGTVATDKFSPLKIVVAVGLIMGLHATFYLFVNVSDTGVSFGRYFDFSFKDIITYLPVSFFYIVSMLVGYWGLRYLELSISSPVQNASGAFAALLLFIFTGETITPLSVIGIIIVTLGVVGIGFLEHRDEEYVQLSLKDKKHSISVLAVIFPFAYCVLDSIGTFLDGIYLGNLITEEAGLVAYEYTFFVVGVIVAIFLACKKEKVHIKDDKYKLIAGALETGGQFFYIFAMAGNPIIVAPVVASYCIVSIILSRIFLKEKLNWQKYVAIAVVVLGIILLGISDGLAGDL